MPLALSVTATPPVRAGQFSVAVTVTVVSASVTVLSAALVLSRRVVGVASAVVASTESDQALPGLMPLRARNPSS